MTIHTRFSPGDIVWTRIGGLPRKVRIGEVRTWSPSPGLTEIIYITAGCDPFEIKESEATATKQELFTL